MEDNGIGEELVFNLDQSALYFKRLPCTTIISKEQSNSFKGEISMKSRDRITEMVCKSSRGKNCPMEYFGKSKQPKCFIDADDDEFNHIYTSNKTS